MRRRRLRRWELLMELLSELLEPATALQPRTPTPPHPQISQPLNAQSKLRLLILILILTLSLSSNSNNSHINHNNNKNRGVQWC